MTGPEKVAEFGPCKVVILAGGFGTRLAERTDEMPKPMVQVGGRPILWHIMKIFSHFGFNDFLIACGYRGDAITRFFLEYREQMSDHLFDFANNQMTRINEKIEPWRVACIDTGAETMTGGRVKRIGGYAGDDTFMLTYGDGVCDVDLRKVLAFHKKHGKAATFTAVRAPMPFGYAELDGDRVKCFLEKPREVNSWINGGFMAVEARVLDRINGDMTNFEIEVLPTLARDGELMAYKHEGFWHAMDTLRDVRNLNAMWNEGKAKWKVWR
ncbi:MAG TPA: glucose-1-phosphate cytidylyltransferase [Phycisphaerales bacterium]|nr:glucose-1-phosphate cytidylyltransferase [Phycisphaerales bacterium]